MSLLELPETPLKTIRSHLVESNDLIAFRDPASQHLCLVVSQVTRHLLYIEFSVTLDDPFNCRCSFSLRTLLLKHPPEQNHHVDLCWLVLHLLVQPFTSGSPHVSCRTASDLRVSRAITIGVLVENERERSRLVEKGLSI
jgi:hypothetical protein